MTPRFRRSALPPLLLVFASHGELAAAPEMTADVAAYELKTAQEAYLNRDYSGAFDLFRKAAEKGSADAQFYLGLMYQEGKGLPQDYDLALIWYRKAANAGQTAAQYNLATLYEKGLGVPADSFQALAWLRKAAQSALAPVNPQPVSAAPGVARAEEGTRKQSNKAQQARLDEARKAPEVLFKELMEQARQGNPEAQYKLGELYETGRGVAQDPVLANEWKTLARQAGYHP